VGNEIWEKASGEFSLKACVKALTGDLAVLVLEKSGSEIPWPAASLPSDVKVGDEVVVTVSSIKQAEETRLTIVRKILEELVN
jgi:hypothetical protein